MLEEKLSELMDKAIGLVDKAEKMTPEAFETAISVVKMDGFNSILFGGFGALIISGLFVVLIFSLFKRDTEFASFEEAIKHVCCIILTVFAVIFFAMSLCNLLDMWNWVAIFDPKLALAKILSEKL